MGGNNVAIETLIVKLTDARNSLKYWTQIRDEHCETVERIKRDIKDLEEALEKLKK
jgi:hypothetical protein